MLSVCGGVPRYLEEIDPSLTVDESLRRSCFTPQGYLFRDFDLMFDELYDKSSAERKSVLNALAKKPMTVSEVAAATGRSRNGHLVELLKDLVQAGFLAQERGINPQTGELRQETRYRICDNYVRFYLKYIEPVKNTIDAGSFGFASLDELNGWESVKGLQFENMVVNNAPQLIRPLGIGRAHVLSCAPYRRTGKLADGVQVDLMIQTQRATYVIEVKRKREIGHEVIKEMERRVAKIPRKEGRSIRTALVYEGHLAPIVEAEGYFDAIVPFKELLGL